MTAETPASATPAASAEALRPWRIAAALVLVLTVLRLGALFATSLDLNPEEAQYWLWSRALDFGYFSKPPMIAWSIWLTTALGGDGEPWVRLSAPLFHAVAGLALFAAGRRLYDDWTGVAAAAIYMLMPGVALSSFILATDAPLLCFLALALLAYVEVQQGGRRLLHAAGLGAALGLAMLSKYAAVYALVAIGLHLALSKDARRVWDLKTAALAMVTFLAVMAPNLIWNANHDFATVGHTAANANLGGRLFNPGEMLSFLGGQFGVFGPVPFGVLVGGAAVLAWRRRLLAQDAMLLCFALPPLVVVSLGALLSRANDNWAASAYVAGTVLAAALLVRWRARWWIAGGLGLQAVMAALMLMIAANPSLADAIGQSNAVKRARGWEQMAEQVVDRARLEQLNGGLSAIAVDDRFLFNALAYYGRDYLAEPGAPPLRIWLRKSHAGNQAETTAPLTPALGRRVLVVSLSGLQADRIAADFAASQRVGILRQMLSLKCAVRYRDNQKKLEHRCLRRETLILGEGFAPVKDRD
ncbi:MAG: glycosyltransferase family 39 protein [Caulobacter sp.]|nr:glycosyltransferase family 39 protein [Caulobacter sp.]